MRHGGSYNVAYGGIQTDVAYGSFQINVFGGVKRVSSSRSSKASKRKVDGPEGRFSGNMPSVGLFWNPTTIQVVSWAGTGPTTSGTPANVGGPEAPGDVVGSLHGASPSASGT